MDAEAVREALERRRRAALDNARLGQYETIRAESKAQAHALTLVLRDLGLESEDGKAITVDNDGTKETKTAAEWASEMAAPGAIFGENY